MSLAAMRDRRLRARRDRHRAPSGVLVVSEDPGFIELVRGAVGELGVRVTACLGPTASQCFLEETGSCPLAEGATVALVDAPPGGSFRYHWHDIPAGEYAEKLQRAHPGTFVMLASNGARPVGPTGEVAVLERETALLLLKWGLPGSTGSTDQVFSRVRTQGGGS